MCSRYGMDEKAAQWMRGYCTVHPNNIAPVRIPKSLIDDWLYDDTHTHEILETATVPLVRHQHMEQISLW